MANPHEVASATFDSEPRVSAWLASVVVVLLIAVIGVGAMILYQMRRVDGNLGTSVPIVESGDRGSNLVQQGFAMRATGDGAGALAAFRRALAADPGNTDAGYHAGAVLIEQGKTKEAEEVLRSTLTADPTHALAAKALAEVYISRREFDRATKVLAPVSDEFPTLADIQYLLGLAAEKDGRKLEAARHYARAAELDTELAAARRGLARVRGGE